MVDINWNTQGLVPAIVQDVDTGQVLMMAVGCLLIYLAIVRKFEPLLLLPIGFGAILSNLSLIHISEPTRQTATSRMPSSA